MGKSDLLRVQDVRDAYRLIGECRDLGNDPAPWHRHMFGGLCRLIGAPAATGGEGLWRRAARYYAPACFAVLTAAAEISERQQIPTHARATVGTQTRVDWRRFDAASNWAVSSRSEDAA